MRSSLVLVLSVGLLASASAQSPSQPYVRMHDDVVRAPQQKGALAHASGVATTIAASAACITLDATATHGTPVPGGGTLSPAAFFNTSIVNDAGLSAFVAQVSGSARNQGVFVSDGTTLTPIAIGCGGGGGSGVPGAGVGDPSPLGGTFSGFFTGTFFTPAINAHGDVLFMADVDGGSAPRGLFLYTAIAGTIVTVSAPGLPSPLGGTFDAVGPGSLNDSGDVVFLGRAVPGFDADIFRWNAGVVTNVAAIGDPAPTGGAYTILGSETLGFADGSSIPVGPLPSIDDSGRVAFRAIASGPVSRGIVVVEGGVHAWRVQANAPAPGGGTFFDMQGASINDDGDVAFFADYKPTPTTFNSGWFVAPRVGPMRRALAFFDALDGGAQCFGLAFSRNPMTPLDDAGNLVVWTDAQFPGGAMQQRIVVCAADGTVSTVVRQTDPTPIGGAFGSLDAWPSLNDVGQAGFGAGTPGAPGVLSAHWRADHATTWVDLGFGLAGIGGEPKLGGTGPFTAAASGSLVLTNARPTATSFLFFAATTSHLPLLGGTLVPTPAFAPIALPTDAAGSWTLSWPSLPGLVPCVDIFLQAWVDDPAGPAGASASNALRATSG